MKALAIGFENIEHENLRKLVQTNLSKENVSFYKLERELVDVLTSEGPFSFVVINLDDFAFSTPETYDNVVDVIGLRPFIFIGTANAVKSQLTNELINNHKTNHVVEVPIIPNDFKKAIALCEAWIRNEEFEQSIKEFPKEDMRALRIKNFFLFEQLPYDVYLELTANKYGKIISKNKFFSHQLLHSYSKKSIKYLYIQKNEHLKILETSIKNLIQVYKDKHVDKNKIVKIHQRTIFFIQEYIKCLSVTDEVNELSHLLSDSISEFISTQKTMTPLLKEIENIKQLSFADASLISAYLCEFIIIEMQWTADMTKERLVLASILQDIYLSNDELIKIRSLNDPLLKLFSEEDQNRFLIHSLKAQEIARLFHGYTELDFILKDHHEHPTGDGFPAGINTTLLSTISCIFIIATHFTAKIALAETDSPVIKEIISSLKKSYSIGNFKEPMKTLPKIFA